MKILVQGFAALSILCFVATFAAIVFARDSSTPRLGVRLAASLLFSAAFIFFGVAGITAAEVERSISGQIPVGAGEGAQFGLFALMAGVIWFGVSLFRFVRRTP